jgi:glycogen operon protein
VDDLLDALLLKVKLKFHGVGLGEPDLGEASHALAMSRTSNKGKDYFYAMVNAYWEPLDFVLPAAPVASGWRLWIDTSQPSPGDIYPRDEAPPVAEGVYTVGSRSIVALVATEE